MKNYRLGTLFSLSLDSAEPPPVPVKHKADGVQLRHSNAVGSDRSNRHTTIIGGQTLQQIFTTGNDPNHNRNTVIETAEVRFFIIGSA